jgi:hypothetical protein
MFRNPYYELNKEDTSQDLDLINGRKRLIPAFAGMTYRNRGLFYSQPRAAGPHSNKKFIVQIKETAKKKAEDASFLSMTFFYS